MRRPYWIPYKAGPYDFPDVEQALKYPDGLLAIGGDLNVNRLMVAYRKGIFPWYSEEEPILWWAPSQRMVLFPEHLHISRSLKKTLKRGKYQLTMDQCFETVVRACAGPRRNEIGTWITDEMLEAYLQLHEYQYAHSVESWYQGELVGGLYGVSLGKIFCGESMFSWMTDASKVAFVHLVRQLQRWEYAFIDCQMYTDHLASFGAFSIHRRQYQILLNHFSQQSGQSGYWEFDQLGWENTGEQNYGRE